MFCNATHDPVGCPMTSRLIQSSVMMSSPCAAPVACKSSTVATCGTIVLGSLTVGSVAVGEAHVVEYYLTAHLLLAE